MDEIIALRVELCHLLVVSLGKYEVTRFAIIRLDRALAIGSFVVSIVASKTTIPVLMAEVIRIGTPIGFHFREEIGFVN